MKWRINWGFILWGATASFLILDHFSWLPGMEPKVVELRLSTQDIAKVCVYRDNVWATDAHGHCSIADRGRGFSVLVWTHAAAPPAPSQEPK